MEERIRFITYKGKPVLLVDVSNCTTAEMIKLASLLPTHLSGKHGKRRWNGWWRRRRWLAGSERRCAVRASFKTL